MKPLPFSIVILLNVDLCASAACHAVPIENATGTHTACPPDPGVSPQHKLIVYFCGSGGSPPNATQAFLMHATSLGFHFFGVNYNDSPSVGRFCRNIMATEPDCFEQIRLVRLFGGHYQGTHIKKADGAVPRFHQALALIAGAQSSEGWPEFFNMSTGALDLDKVIVAGESQGSGMALMLSQHYAVHRVLQFAGVDDVYPKDGVATAAPWVARKDWKTSINNIYGLGNINGFCCEWWHITWPAAGMIGSWMNVDGASAPFAGARMLCSSKSEALPHGAPVSDATYAPVWTYMLTGSATFNETAAAIAGGCDCPSIALV